MKSFFVRYQPVFEIVCRILGNGWRVNLLDDCQYRIKITSPRFKNYSVHIRMDKARLAITGSVDSRNWRGPYHSCTVSPKHNPVEIASDIEKKILINELQDVEDSRKFENKMREERERIQILKGMLQQLFNIESWHGTLTGFKAENGLSGHVTERGDGYEVLIRGLNMDQLVRLVGLIKQL